MDKKKVIIIGAGISGLSSARYLLDNDFDVTIIEKHNIVGGECTGWRRKGLTIEGCAHFIGGTNPDSDLYPLWRHCGAFDSTTKIYDTEYFDTFDCDGEIVTFYADLEKLRNELLSHTKTKKDIRLVNYFCNAIKVYTRIKPPIEKPLDKMNLFELISFGFKMIPVLGYMPGLRRLKVRKFSEKFDSPSLKESFRRIMNEHYNLHALVYVFKTLAMRDAGVIEGGSLKMTSSMKDTLIENGCNIILRKEVKEILVENDTAKGVIFSDGDVMYSDYVISSADAYHTLYHLLKNKYRHDYFDIRYLNNKHNPLSVGMLCSVKIKKDVSNYPKMLSIPIERFEIADTVIDNLALRNFAFDRLEGEDGTLITTLIDCNEGVYSFFKGLSKEEYKLKKNEIGERITNEIKNYMKLNDDEIEFLDLATPLTYERYCNAYKGSYMSFIITDKTKGLMGKGIIPGLKNFCLAGQWLMPPGGLPVALFTGKHAAYRITRMEKREFIDLDCQYKNESKLSLKEKLLLRRKGILY